MKDRDIDKKASNMIGWLTVVLFLIGGIIVLCFRMLPYGEQLEIKDYFNFASSYIGASVGAIISLFVLYITVGQTREIQKENNKQVYIINLNEILNNLRNRLLLFIKTDELLSIYEFSILSDVLEYKKIDRDNILKVIEVLSQTQLLLINEFGIIGTDKILSDDTNMLKINSELLDYGRKILEVYDDDLCKDKDKIIAINRLRDRFREKYMIYDYFRSIKVNETQDEIVTYSRKKYLLLEEHK